MTTNRKRMVCSECRGEFREGIVVCPDCGVELLAELPAGAEDSSQESVVDSDSLTPLATSLWRGELSLVVTFWGFAVAGGLLLRLLADLMLEGVMPADPEAAALVGFPLYLALFAYSAFLWIPVWRSAEKYRGRPIWAKLAQFIVAAQVVGVALYSAGLVMEMFGL